MVATGTESAPAAGQHQASAEMFNPLSDGLEPGVTQAISGYLLQHQRRRPHQIRQRQRPFGAQLHTHACRRQRPREIARLTIATDHQHAFATTDPQGTHRAVVGRATVIMRIEFDGIIDQSRHRWAIGEGDRHGLQRAQIHRATGNQLITTQHAPRASLSGVGNQPHRPHETFTQAQLVRQFDIQHRSIGTPGARHREYIDRDVGLRATGGGCTQADAGVFAIADDQDPRGAPRHDQGLGRADSRGQIRPIIGNRQHGRFRHTCSTRRLRHVRLTRDRDHAQAIRPTALITDETQQIRLLCAGIIERRTAIEHHHHIAAAPAMRQAWASRRNHQRDQHT